MQCINFDKKFLEFTNQWVEAHGEEYKTMEALEDDMPHIYMTFLNTPAPWLKGLTPGSYFTEYEDPKVLVDWLDEYCKTNVPVPDVLQEQILQVGVPCEKRLMALLEDGSSTQEGKMMAIGLLRDLESQKPMKLYIKWQLDRAQEDELCENAIESLKEMGKEAQGPMERALDKANTFGQEALLDVLVNYPGSERVFQLTLMFFEKNTSQRAIYASYLAKLNDMRALPLLKETALNQDISYLDYIEIRNAIETLGGDCPAREFPDDPAYEAFGKMN